MCGAHWSAKMFRWVASVKVTSKWMPSCRLFPRKNIAWQQDEQCYSIYLHFNVSLLWQRRVWRLLHGTVTLHLFPILIKTFLRLNNRPTPIFLKYHYLSLTMSPQTVIKELLILDKSTFRWPTLSSPTSDDCYLMFVGHSIQAVWICAFEAGWYTAGQKCVAIVLPRITCLSKDNKSRIQIGDVALLRVCVCARVSETMGGRDCCLQVWICSIIPWYI